ncbi:MAG TPA: HD domain-containing protein, partial [Xanthomonadaceae bacterium]|nr:HD domain-containing protein [Xanthomonadaceae bacterium]
METTLARTGISPLVREALEFATAAHAGQVRKYLGVPYITHPIAVARMVLRFGGDNGMVAAALLHDTIEDCDVTEGELRGKFGADITQLVVDLTDVSRPEHGPRAVRKAMDREHVAGASPRAKTIKSFDLAHNTRSIVRHDPRFARTYLTEKAALLDVLATPETGDPFPAPPPAGAAERVGRGQPVCFRRRRQRNRFRRLVLRAAGRCPGHLRRPADV